MYVVTKEEFIAGWISGMIGISIGHPFDTVKVKQQISGSGKKSILEIANDIFKTNGMRGFFRGLGVPVITAGIVNSTFFGIYGNVLKLAHYTQGIKDLKEDPYWAANVLVCGLWGGFAQCFVANPVEIIKIRLQTRPEYLVKQYMRRRLIPLHDEGKRNVGMYGIIKEIYKFEGIAGFYRGFILMLVRDTPSFGLYMFTFESMSKLTNDCIKNENFRYILAGSLAGIASWIFVIPIDICKSRIQSSGQEQQKYKGMVDCLVKTYQEGGIKLLMKGTSLILLRCIPLNAALFLSYKKSMEIMRPTIKAEDVSKNENGILIVQNESVFSEDGK